MTDRLVLLLPAAADRNVAAAPWWRLSDDRIIEEGSDDRWVELAARSGSGGGLPLIALAPLAPVRLAFPQVEGNTQRQQAGVARARALADSFAEPETLHAVTGETDGRLAVAVVANGQMIDWLDWLTAFGVDPQAIVPAGLIVPLTDEWIAAAIGPEDMLGRAGMVLPDEPALRDALVGEAPVRTLDRDEVAARLVQLARTAPLNLRSGRFARRRLFVLDRARFRELASLALAIPLIGLVMALVMIARLDRSSDRLEAETARLASAALGREVTAAVAISALDSGIGSVPGASGSPFVPLTAAYQQMQQVRGLTATKVQWQANGTLTLGLSATRAEDVNRLLAGLQRSGYRVTATSRASPTGQTLTDITVRSSL